ncbi:MAG: DNA helicase [Candidatus Parcubacteria bacterium]|nr:DNA helicase [Candidatus Parcubacteria bacterium]
MKSEFSQNFLDALDSFPLSIQKKFEKQLKFLVSNIRHPSLHAKKYDESSGTWQARVDKSVRFYSLIEKDVYILVNIQYHD